MTFAILWPRVGEPPHSSAALKMQMTATGARLPHYCTDPRRSERPFPSVAPKRATALIHGMSCEWNELWKWKEELKQLGLLRSNSPHPECKASPAWVWVLREGEGDLTNAWWEGTGPSTLLALPNGYFVHCPVAPTPLLPFFRGRVHFVSGPLWRVKGLSGWGVAWVCWLTLVSAARANATLAGIWGKKLKGRITNKDPFPSHWVHL